MHTKTNRAAVLIAASLAAATAVAGPLDNAWLMGATDKDPLTYRPGEEMVFTVTPRDLDGAVPAYEGRDFTRRRD